MSNDAKMMRLRMQRRSTRSAAGWGRAGCIGGAVLATILVPILSGEVPRWRPGGTAAVAHRSLAPLDPVLPALPADATVTCEGDSITARASGSRSIGYPETLARLLPTMRIVNHGRGGDTAADGWRRWRPVPGEALVVLMYGTNDAAPRGPIGRRRPVPPKAFIRILTAIAQRHRAAGAQVLILAPPPAGSAAGDARIAPYRQAARLAAARAGVAFRDPAPAFAGLSVPLRYDALHPGPEALAALAHWLARQISTVSASSQNPHTSLTDRGSLIPSS